MSKKIFISFIVVLSFAGFYFGSNDVQAYAPQAMITFTFDDGSKNIYNRALPLLAVYNLPAVFYGETGPLNSSEDWVMTWDQVRALQNTYGWEIGSHSITHPYLTSVSNEQLVQELVGSKQGFAAQGINVKTFATPYGDYNNQVLAEIAKYYESHRAAWGGPTVWPYNDYEIVIKEVANNILPATVKTWINEAITNKQWLVLLFHDIVTGKAQPYEYNVSQLKNIINFTAGKKQIKVVTISQGLNVTNQPNLINNFSFSQLDASSWALGWQRSDETNVNVDTANHGNISGPENSLKIIGGTDQHWAKSDLIKISGNQEYFLKMYFNLQNLVSGGGVIWLDEFDVGSNWIGGKWLGGAYLNFVGDRYYQYQPSSATVDKIQIKIYTDTNSQLTLYLDSLELRALGPININPNPNLVENYSFENLTNGWADKWNRDDEINVLIDTNSNGLPPLAQNSLKIIAGATQITAFSSLINVSSSQTYQLTYYQKISDYLSGGAAVWVDEYNSLGAWVSGKWLGGTYQAWQGMKSYSYKPTSTKVKKIQIHLFTEEGSQLTLYIDAVELRANSSQSSAQAIIQPSVTQSNVQIISTSLTNSVQ